MTPAQILLAWAINRGTSVIPKSTNPQRQEENLMAVEIDLNEVEMGQLCRLNADYRFVDGTFWERDGGPYTVTELWDE